MGYWQKISIVLRICLEGRARLILAITLSVGVFNLLDLAVPKVLQLLVATLEGNPLLLAGYDLGKLLTPENRVLFFCLCLPALAACKWCVDYLKDVLQARFGQSALFDLRNRIYEQIQSLSFAYHDQNHSGRFIANIVEDVGQVSHFLERPLFMLLEVGAGLLAIYGFMYSVCPAAALYSGGLLILGLVGIELFRRWGYPLYLRARQRLEEMVSAFSENIEGHLLIRSFGRQEQQRERFGRSSRDYHDAQLYSRVVWSVLNQSLLWGVVLGFPAVIWAGVAALQAGELGNDGVFLLFMLQNSLILRMRISSRIIDQTTQFSVSAQRLGGLFFTTDYLPDVGADWKPPLSVPEESAPGDKATAQAQETGAYCTREFPAGDLELNQVTFNYRNQTPALRDINVRIPQGGTLGLVGETGSGKSTLALLMCRFYDPDSGSITIGGVDIRSISLRRLRREFALVFQDTFLFSATIAENIAYGNPQALPEEVEEAARLARADAFIRSFPEGYQTRIGEKGVTLSGGQRQRIAIARAILRRPRYLVLDDATSSLDMETEGEIQDSIDSLPAGITKIIIAHRFSSIARANMICVLSDGHIIERGTPAELHRSGSQMSRILQLHHVRGE